MAKKKYDFSGWATRANIKCSDGKIIRNNAFAGCDGEIVPLVWNHQHNDPNNILGHALLKNKGDGVYAYCSFNDGESGRAAKMLVEHGDISSLSILANQLKMDGPHVIHGVIREVSLVLAGANPKANIEEVLTHNENGDIVVEINFNSPLSLEHGEIDIQVEDVLIPKDEVKEKRKMNSEKTNKKDSGEKTIADILDSLTEEQKTVVYALIGEAIQSEETNKKETEKMKHNIFDNEEENNDVLVHDAMNTIISDAKRFGSLKESFLQHADDYGISQIDYLFPEAKSTSNSLEFIKRDTGWVSDVMRSVHKTPFSRIKSIFADIREDEARAKGYMKGKLKKDEVFSLLKRTTSPTTIYKKQRMDRDDVVDIIDFDVISWLKSEMRMMLDEEIARAILVGDGRLSSSDDKINEHCIRPIWKDEELYTIKKTITLAGASTAEDRAKAFINAAIKARKDYKGSGNPVLYTTEDLLTDMLLITDKMGRDVYESVEKLAMKLRVSKIVTVPIMEGLMNDEGHHLMGIFVNLIDYNVGADKGGSVNMFDDFDIDYNQQKYLIETRCSGALIKPFSAIAIELEISG